MTTATMTSKGQITVPKKIRDALGLKPGDRLGFYLEDDGTVRLQPETKDLRLLFGVLEPTHRGVTIEDMEEAIAEGVTET